MSSRAERRLLVEQQILDLGRTQLATVGAAALSLRAIARDLGMVSSAIYRYVESRDELLTRLVVEAYRQLADEVDGALSGATVDGPRARLTIVARTFRAWALSHPAQFALLYGSPVPGYHAPSERTVEPGTRVMRTMLALLDHAAAARLLTVDDVLGVASPPRPLDARLPADLAAIRTDVGVELSDAELVFALALWTWLIGAVSQEIFGGFGADTFSAPEALFDAQLARQLAAVIG